MKLYAISDLHLAYEANRQALAALPPHRDDWLITAGDTGEEEEHLRYALEILTDRFARVIWVPGNHDLWSRPSRPDSLRGEAKYRRLVEICRRHGVSTPEDPYPRWPGPGPSCRLVPLFLLYDYTFRPDEVSREMVIEWAAESGIMAADEALLRPDPHASRDAWCAERCRLSEERLRRASREGPLVLINHWPLRRDLVRLPRVPRFSPWCGTRRSEDWHRRYPVEAVVYGHLHIRGTHERDGVRFEEVSLGYPRDWDPAFGIDAHLRQILPGPVA